MDDQPTPPRTRTEEELTTTLCLVFRLTPVEARMLAELLANEYCSKQTLQALNPGAGRSVASRSTTVQLSTLREKLQLHEIRVFTINRVGFGLGAADRARIYTAINKFDEQLNLHLDTPPDRLDERPRRKARA